MTAPTDETPTPAKWPRARLELPSAYVAPRSELEARVTRIWETVLWVAPIGVNDDFFDLGGESIHAFAVIGRVERDFAVALKARDLFSCATTAAMAAVIHQRSCESGGTQSVQQIGRSASASGGCHAEPETEPETEPQKGTRCR